MTRPRRWRTATGDIIAFTDLTDDHLVNIMRLCQRRGMYPTLSVPADEFSAHPSTEVVDDLIAEARRRGLENPWGWTGIV